MLYAQLLVVCTLCQAWNSIELYLEFGFVLGITVECTISGCVHIVPSLGI
jgi:hypothetical protein